MTVQPCPKKDVPVVLALSFAPSRRAARTGPIKAGGLLYVLDRSRWTQQMRYAIDQLMAKHYGQKDFLAKVDVEYAAVIQAASRDPNSLLHPITKQHISRYVKHLAKMTNTSSSLNTSTEKLLETQQLWHHLTVGRDVKYFYCSTKVYQTYAAEGLANPRMPFADFACTPFFRRELEAAKQRSTPSKQAEGMTRGMTWAEFCQSSFYEAEKRRWAVEKGKSSVGAETLLKASSCSSSLTTLRFYVLSRLFMKQCVFAAVMTGRVSAAVGEGLFLRDDLFIMKVLLLLTLLTVSGCDSSRAVGQTGQNVTLTCKYDIIKNGAAHVCWGRGQLPTSRCDNQLISTDGYKVIEETRVSSRYQLLGRLNEGDVSLTILNLTKEDAGKYGCRVEIPGWFNDEKHQFDLSVERTPALTTSAPSDTQTFTESTDPAQTTADLMTTENLLTSCTDSSIPAERQQEDSMLMVVLVGVLFLLVVLATATGLFIMGEFALIDLAAAKVSVKEK
ncbi:hypothetical protein CHARACLAT_022183 [Characodon lateralis]|uniref:Ig-like domain-containing protein n=1 Tax=Characodon lateralis TaxID=208331 RepID=A0ABU7CQQ7_9TELE|nr:hypothetical protein [Characodon lateralis]